jgi:hypothetical protein
VPTWPATGQNSKWLRFDWLKPTLFWKMVMLLAKS